jgi:hypothetical protein
MTQRSSYAIPIDSVLIYYSQMKDSLDRPRSTIQLTIAGLESSIYTVKLHSGLKTLLPLAVLGGAALAGALWLGWKLGELTALL